MVTTDSLEIHIIIGVRRGDAPTGQSMGVGVTDDCTCARERERERERERIMWNGESCDSWGNEWEKKARRPRARWLDALKRKRIYY